MHLIGIELIDCRNDIFKNLKKKGDVLPNGEVFNGWYPFCNYSSSDKPPAVDKTIQFDIPNSFYNIYGHEKNINVSCIVGKNGSGKSTLLEIVYRIINNLSFCIKHFFPYNGCDLDISLGFKAVLYYSEEINGKEYVGYIKNNDNTGVSIKIPKNEEINIDLIVNNENNKPILNKPKLDNFSLQKLEDLFYTIATNYSMYSFNPEDYKKNRYYPKGIFHKNDAYITPIVLLPFRNELGVIEIDNERDLARQRIIALQVFLYNFRNEKHELIQHKKPLKISYKFDESYVSKHNQEEIKKQFNEFQKSVNDFLNSDKDNIHKYTKQLILNQMQYNSYFEDIKKAWMNKVLTYYKKETLDEFVLDSSLREALFHYLTFKTIKTCAHYGLYLQLFDFRNLQESTKEIISEILEDRTFITLKLRQCFNFFSLDYKYENGLTNLNYKDISKIQNNKEQCIDDYFLQLPPSVFITDLVFEDTNTKIEINLSSLSSGELQLLNSFSYLLYHLKNLECNKSNLSKKNNIDYPNYKNFVLIFDEAELYMHPEYQRLFLYRLIESILNCHFNNFIQIHIIIATHSPYILSDIPIQNVLMLDDGKIQKKNFNISQTFGANIYDLLKNLFFMSAPVGEFARNIINEVILNMNSDKQFLPEELDAYEDKINFLGDSYLKNSLLYLLNKKRKEIRDKNV